MTIENKGQAGSHEDTSFMSEQEWLDSAEYAEYRAIKELKPHESKPHEPKPHESKPHESKSYDEPEALYDELAASFVESGKPHGIFSNPTFSDLRSSTRAIKPPVTLSDMHIPVTQSDMLRPPKRTLSPKSALNHFASSVPGSVPGYEGRIAPQEVDGNKSLRERMTDIHRNLFDTNPPVDSSKDGRMERLSKYLPQEILETEVSRVRHGDGVKESSTINTDVADGAANTKDDTQTGSSNPSVSSPASKSVGNRRLPTNGEDMISAMTQDDNQDDNGDFGE